MKTAICPGSFDPVTNGHLDVIERASKIFDEVYVVVMTNYQKIGSTTFTEAERVDLIERSIGHLPNVRVDTYNGLLADYAADHDIHIIVKGLRAVSDFENEFQMALINKKINPELDTMFLTAESQYMYLSSSMVKELGSYGVDLSDFLPEEIISDFQNKLGI